MNHHAVLSARILLVLFAGLLFSSTSFASIVSGVVTTPVGGSFNLIAPPAAVGNNNFDIEALFAFDELQDVVFMSDLNVDVTPMGGGAGVISAGTAISSHYVFYDPKTFIQQIGSVFFDTNVIGIITSLGTLAASDFLGGPWHYLQRTPITCSGSR